MGGPNSVPDNVIAGKVVQPPSKALLEKAIANAEAAKAKFAEPTVEYANFDELMRAALVIFPDALVMVDKDGEITIHTGFRESVVDGRLERMPI